MLMVTVGVRRGTPAGESGDADGSFITAATSQERRNITLTTSLAQILLVAPSLIHMFTYILLYYNIIIYIII